MNVLASILFDRKLISIFVKLMNALARSMYASMYLITNYEIRFRYKITGG